MRAIMVMYDSLNRRILPPYGGTKVHAPNFARLAQNCVTFDNCYVGSMPCIPARRELHTGRYNFLHRSWGPLEPFDDSMPAILSENGVYTHLVSDHQHYWEDGGATYHTRYDSWDFSRGQEGDPYKGVVAVPMARGPTVPHQARARRQDHINRTYQIGEAAQPQTLTFNAGLEFIRTNSSSDKWFLQIETFDPHEPFFTQQSYKGLYPHTYTGGQFDWPVYGPVTESAEVVEHVRCEYAALVSMCDQSLGRVLSAMDELALWRDTMLIVCTDHGFLLGEHGWWAKNVPPWFNEISHTPLFVWDPRTGVRGERRHSLVQMIDFAPTLLDYFGVKPPRDMQGTPLRELIERDTPARNAGLFGAFGAYVNVTDGRYVYMRSCNEPSNQPLFEYTLMPTHMRARFEPQELLHIELAEPFSFTKSVRPLRIPGRSFGGSKQFGTMLFDLERDPEQKNPIVDDDIELRMIGLLLTWMRATDAPMEQYDRLGLPRSGEAGKEHLFAHRDLEEARRFHASKSIF
jgi:arylsulfatase A-like enzyme